MNTANREHLVSMRPRFWNPHGTELKVLPDGFLFNPLDDFQRHFNPELAQLVDLRDRACLVLLGEPGAGKSTSLTSERDALRLAEPDETTLHFDLAEYPSEDAICRHVFGDPAWQSWRDGRRLNLFLDSYDECRLSLRTVANVLVRELRKLGQRDRLFLRIACRAGAWPIYLHQQLDELWPSPIAVYDLAPLRWQDAEAMLAELGIEDVDGFTKAVDAVDATPMLSSPLSLQMVANIFLRYGALPARRSDLFQQGCLALCTEHNRSRTAAGFHGNLNPDQRLQVAMRIAALTTLCGRIGVWIGNDHDQQSDAAFLSIREISGGLESAQGTDFAVTDDALREVTTDTRLFTPVGPERVTWAHRTYAEFLASRYLMAHGIPIEQIRALLCHPEMGRLIPQLRGVAAWLGSRPDVLRLIQDTDAELLFSVDLTMHDASTRAAAVDAILATARKGGLSDAWLTQSQYRRLAHPGIAAQVVPIIHDRSRGWLERRVAIDIAEQCCLAEAQSVLLEVVLDSTDDFSQRSNALSALSRSENAGFHQSIRDLLDTGLSDDHEDDLRGGCLRVLWPASLPTSELLRYLTPKKRNNYFGSYRTHPSRVGRRAS
jgi:hypothetical protein